MATLRTVVSAVMSKGVLSEGWNAILTGVAFLYVAYLLGMVADGDSAAPFVAVVLAVAGAWQLERGLRAEFQRRPKSTDTDEVS
jgi:hypothetical protein